MLFQSVFQIRGSTLTLVRWTGHRSELRAPHTLDGPGRAPLEVLALWTSACAPSPGSAFLPGKEKRSPLGRRLLKGQRRPSLSISPIATPPSLSDTCREPLKPGFPLPAESFFLGASPSVQDGLDGRGQRWICLALAAAATGKAVQGTASTAIPAGQTRRWLFGERSTVFGCLECGPPQ